MTMTRTRRRPSSGLDSAEGPTTVSIERKAMNRLFLLCNSLVFGSLVSLVGCGGASTAPGFTAGDAAVDGTYAATDGTAGATGTTGGGDAGQMFVADGGSPATAGPGGNTSTLPCGNAQCTIPAQQCCVIANLNPPPDFSYACYSGSCPVTGGGGGGMSTALSCSGAANCPANTVCCVTQTQSGAASSCAATCNQNGAQLCDPNAASSGCPQGVACSSRNIGDWGLPNGFATCGGVGN